MRFAHLTLILFTACTSKSLDVGAARTPQVTDDASSPPPAAAAGETSAPHHDCSLPTPFLEDFENGISTEWGAANPVGLSIDTDKPLGGTKSLHVGGPFAATSPAFVAITFPQATCSLDYKLSIRANASLVSRGSVSLVTFGKQPLFVRLLLSGGKLLLTTEVSGQQTMGEPFYTLPPDTPTRVQIIADLTTSQTFVAAAPLGSPLPAALASLPVSGETFANTTLGLGPASVNPTDAGSGRATGDVWIDDVSIE